MFISQLGGYDILNKKLRIDIGNNGRGRVNKLYNWDNNVKQMINIYKEILNG